MFFAAVDAMAGQLRSATMARFNNDPAAKAIMDRSLDRFLAAGKAVIGRHVPAFMDAYAQGYAREFSIAELEQLLAFVQTPAGAHYFLRSSAIIADPAFAAANTDYIRELQPLIEKMRTDLTQELGAYYASHPPKTSVGS